MELGGLILIGMAAISLIAAIYVFTRPKPQGTIPAAVPEREGLTDLTKLIEAITKMVDALQKAGPAIALLAASLVFAVSGVALLSADTGSDGGTGSGGTTSTTVGD